MTKILATVFLTIFCLAAPAFQNRISTGQQQLLFAGKNKGKFWDARYGYNWHFAQNGAFTQFDYNDAHKRVFVSVSDVLIGPLTWNIMHDTIYVKTKKEVYLKYLICKLTEDSLVVFDFNKSWGRDTLFFSKSADQSQYPTK